MNNKYNILKYTENIHKYVVIGISGNITWQPDCNGFVSIESDTILIKDSIGNIKQAYRSKPGEQMDTTE